MLVTPLGGFQIPDFKFIIAEFRSQESEFSVGIVCFSRRYFFRTALAKAVIPLKNGIQGCCSSLETLGSPTQLGVEK
jgi:hypothetical protein